MQAPYSTTVTAERLAPSETSVDESRTLQDHLNEARTRFHAASDSETAQRLQMLEDLRFRADRYQWDPAVAQERRRLGRPVLTVNRIPQFLKQVGNDCRQNRPSVQINPVGDGADQDTAEVIEGLTRHIEVSSDADIAYDTAFEHMITMGLGFMRATNEYVTPGTFENDQEIRIQWVPDPFTVYFDPSCREPDWSDAQYCFVVEDMTMAEFERRFPDAEKESLEDFRGVGDTSILDWYPGGKIRVAEYFFKEKGKRIRARLADGRETWADRIPPESTARIVSQIEVDVTIVHREIITASQILEKTIWPGQFIPIIPVIGDEVRLDGERQLIGMVRYARDAQRMYNYMYSSIVETIAMAQKAPWLVEAGQIEDFEQIWKQASNRPMAYLPYKARSIFGSPVPPPQRNVAEPPIAALSAALQQADNMLKAVFGIYDASLGSRGPQESGKAILARQRESDTANFNYIDNMSRAIRYLGRVLLDAIPNVYDRPGRVMHILDLDESKRPVMLNQPFVSGNGQLEPLSEDQANAEEMIGVAKLYDLGVGRYDVTVTAGPSYSTKRQEGVSAMLELVRIDPALMQIAGDQIIGQMDFPGARQIAARVKKTLPPALQNDDPNAPKIPPQIQAQLQEQSQMIQQLTQTVNKQSELIETDRMGLESKERIAIEGNLTTLISALIKQEGEASRAQLDAEMRALEQRLQLLNVDQPVGDGAPTPTVQQPTAPGPA